MEFRTFIMETQIWDDFVDTHFVGEFQGLSHDFYCWLRRYDIGKDESLERLERLFKEWQKSGRIGRWCQALDRRRRQQFGPGKYHAASPSGTFLNKNFVKGWRGVNPRNP